MKLISCHVENFGRLHDYDMDFTQGVNVIRQDNGWGKSTLACFIKAMFYGLDGDKKRSAAENERKRFRPWQGGTFGGRLLFEAGEKSYLVSRTFGDTAAKDTFELRNADSNLISGDYSKDLGKNLFRIDSASFYRTVFISQSGCATGSTDDIHAKISNLSDNTDDINNFQSAEKLLCAQINRLTPDRATGSLRRRQDELAELRRKALEGNDLDAQIARKENERRETERRREAGANRRAELEAIQQKAIQAQQTLFLRSERQRLEKAKTDAEAAFTTRKGDFSRGVPSLETISGLLQSAENMEKSRGLMAAYELTPAEQGEMAALEVVFGDRPPTKEETEGYISKERMLRYDRQRYGNTRLTTAENEFLDRLNAAFSGEGAQISKAISLWKDRCEKAGALNFKQTMLVSVTASDRSEQAARRRMALLPAVAGCVLLACGLPLLFLSPVAGNIAALSGAILAAVGVVFYIRKRASFAGETESDKALALKNEIESDRKFISEADGFISRFLACHGRAFEESEVYDMLAEIRGEKQEQESLTKRAEEAARISEEGRFAEIDGAVREFVRQYELQGAANTGDLWADRLFRIASNAEKYRAFLGRRERYAAAQAEYASGREKINAFLDQYGFPAGDDLKSALESVRDKAEGYLARQNALHQAEKELAAFEAENPVIPSTDTEEELPSLEEITAETNDINAAMEALNDTVTQLSGELTALNERYDRWEEACAKLEEQTARQEEEQRRYDRLVKAREHLRLAKERMTAQFTDPITRRFASYYEMLTGVSAAAFRVDAEANVTAEEFGAQRDVSLLSTGYRDLTGICLRLALADAMYPDEKPPLILDDPFAFLDDGKLAASKAFLQAVGEKYQIIYFTCASSRK